MADLRSGAIPKERERQIPAWVTRPLPTNAVIDDNLITEVEKACQKLPDRIGFLGYRIRENDAGYDAALNRMCELVWAAYQEGKFIESEHLADLATFVIGYFTPKAKARVLFELSKHNDHAVRRQVRKILLKSLHRFHDVSLPRIKNAPDTEPNGQWDQVGWTHGLRRQNTPGSKGTNNVQERLNLPSLDSIKSLRKLLGIRSPAQLGWMLSATDDENGPYTSFEIPKKHGEPRKICAPKWQLRSVQRKILEEILYRIPVHSAAHGFVPGRSTRTNAEPHVGKRIVVKFDLQNFFPTIHHFRAVGLFVSLGYEYSNGRFSNEDRSAQIAPTLARLCMYTQDPAKYGEGYLPQGAPTSPAITNLICRTLDIRLTGLAESIGGVYTRYADDLTFSFVDDLDSIGRLRWWVTQICHQEGFFVHQGKFRVIRSSQRQQVTGIVVNESLRVPRHYRRRFRAILHNCRQHGIDSQARGRIGFRGWLQGYASYIHMIHPDEGRELLVKVNELFATESGKARGDQ